VLDDGRSLERDPEKEPQRCHGYETAGIHHFLRRGRSGLVACRSRAARRSDAADRGAHPLAEHEPETQSRAMAFQRTLAELGWTDGHNVRIDYRFGGGAERIRTHAAELVSFAPDVVVGTSTAVVTAFRQATHTIPIVFAGVMDPVGQGLASSLARPGGHITGFGLEEPNMGGKWLDLLKAIAPRVARIAVIFNPDTAPYARLFLPSMEAAGLFLSVEQIASSVRTEAESSTP
jgi:putative ABC transport system substrate-binding protein